MLVEEMENMKRKGKWIRTDAWRGYWKPAGAIVGQSIYGEKNVRDEQNRDLKIMRKVFKRLKIPYRTRYSKTSNLFSVKRWLVIPKGVRISKEKRKMIEKIAKEKTESFHNDFS